MLDLRNHPVASAKCVLLATDPVLSISDLEEHLEDGQRRNRHWISPALQVSHDRTERAYMAQAERIGPGNCTSVAHQLGQADLIEALCLGLHQVADMGATIPAESAIGVEAILPAPANPRRGKAEQINMPTKALGWSSNVSRHRHLQKMHRRQPPESFRSITRMYNIGVSECCENRFRELNLSQGK